jgi:protease-4
MPNIGMIKTVKLVRRSRNKVAVVKVEGIISDSDLAGASRMKVVSALKEAERKKARAVVLRVNSPGGSVAACQEVYRSVLRLKEKGILVVASMGEVAASGGVYVSMAANEIVANPGTITGSIGVIIRSSDLSSLYNKVGVSPKVVKSGPHKDMLSTYRSFSTDEQAILQDLINDSHDQFVEIVMAARKKSRDEVERIADGRIMTGRQAVQVGLVDSLGDMETAIERAASLANIEGKPDVIIIQPKRSLWQKLFGHFFGLAQQAVAGEHLAGIPLWLLPKL